LEKGEKEAPQYFEVFLGADDRDFVFVLKV
jgi:hypothetical protein